MAMGSGAGANVLESIRHDNATLYEHILSHPNTTQHALIVLSAYANTTAPSLPAIGVHFILFYNSTMKNPHALELLRSLDELILAKKANLSATSIDVALKSYPRYVHARRLPFAHCAQKVPHFRLRRGGCEWRHGKSRALGPPLTRGSGSSWAPWSHSFTS
jgi:hypothetical protein